MIKKHLTALKSVAKFDGSVAFVEKKPKLFSSYNVIKLLFSLITLRDVLNSLISRYLLAGCRLHLGFLEGAILNLTMNRV